MTMSVTQLRANIYNIVDEIIKTGHPIDIERDGIRLRIVLAHVDHCAKTKKLDRLIPREDIMTASPNDYVHMDWSDEWKP